MIWEILFMKWSYSYIGISKDTQVMQQHDDMNDLSESYVTLIYRLDSPKKGRNTELRCFLLWHYITDDLQRSMTAIVLFDTPYKNP